jgi:hypothetical protein
MRVKDDRFSVNSHLRTLHDVVSSPNITCKVHMVILTVMIHENTVHYELFYRCQMEALKNSILLLYRDYIGIYLLAVGSAIFYQV